MSFQVTWRVIIALCFLALFLGFFWLLMLRGCAMFLIMGTILAFAVALIGLSLLAWDKAGMIRIASIYNELAVHVDAVELSGPWAEAVAVIITAIAVAYLLLVCCMFKRIRIAVRLIQESARAVVEIPTMVLFPVSTFFAFLLLCTWTVIIGTYLASAGEFDPVLGSYSYAARVRLAGKQGCADGLEAMNPLWLSVEGRNQSYVMGRAEAERLCVVYGSNATEALAGWEMSAAERVRTGGLGGVSDLKPEGRDMSVKDWFGGGFRQDLPFDVVDFYQWFWAYHVFAFLWTYMFLLSCLFMSISGAVGKECKKSARTWYSTSHFVLAPTHARDSGTDRVTHVHVVAGSWYWREEGETLTGLPVVRSFLRLLSYQLGTAALGSFIVSVIWMARISFQVMYIPHRPGGLTLAIHTNLKIAATIFRSQNL